jgi:hypothetical protein
MFQVSGEVMHVQEDDDDDFDSDNDADSDVVDDDDETNKENGNVTTLTSASHQTVLSSTTLRSNTLNLVSILDNFFFVTDVAEE